LKLIDKLQINCEQQNVTIIILDIHIDFTSKILV